MKKTNPTARFLFEILFGPFLFFCLTCLLPRMTFAGWNLRPQAGLGATDNANFESANTDSDFFWWVRSSNSYFGDKNAWNLWFNYRDYFEQNQNDVFSYRLGRTAELQTPSLGNFEWDIAFGGQQYLNENPGTTEQSFNNIFLETSIVKTRALKSNLEWTFGPLYQLTSYPSLSGRTDHTLLLSLGLDWQMTPLQTLTPSLDLGYVISNQDLYTKQFVEIGTDWRIEATQTLKYIFHFVSKFSSYPHRLVSDTTAVTTRTGRVRVTSRDEIERQTFYQIQASLAKLLGSTELRASAALNQNSTLSGVEDYKEMQITGAITVPFDLP